MSESSVAPIVTKGVYAEYRVLAVFTEVPAGRSGSSVGAVRRSDTE